MEQPRSTPYENDSSLPHPVNKSIILEKDLKAAKNSLEAKHMAMQRTLQEIDLYKRTLAGAPEDVRELTNHEKVHLKNLNFKQGYANKLQQEIDGISHTIADYENGLLIEKGSA